MCFVQILISQSLTKIIFYGSLNDQVIKAVRGINGVQPIKIINFFKRLLRYRKKIERFCKIMVDL